MSLISIVLILFPVFVHGEDVSIFLGHSPYDWMDTNTILYNYKGFFNPMVDLVKADTKSHWAWQDEKTFHFKTADPPKDYTTRSLGTWHTLSKIFEMDKNEKLQGIIGVSQSSEGAFGSEMCNVTYFHTYSDNIRDLQLEKPGEEKIDIFRKTIRLGPTTSFIVSGALDFLHWIEGTSSNTLENVELKVFHENSFGSEKIAELIRTTARDTLPTWKVRLSSYDLDVFAGATTDSNYLFREKISKLDFFNITCTETLTQARGVIVIGSIGFIRHTAIEMYKAAQESKFSFDEYLIIGIPATLWPLPSYKAEDMLQIRDHFIKSSDDDTAKLAFRNMFVITDVFNVTRYNELAKTVQDKFYQDTPQVPSQDWTANRPVPTWSGYTHDALLLLMKAIKEVEKPSDFYPYLVNKTWNETDFEGISPFSGSIEINKFGDRVSTLNIHHFGANNQWTAVGQIKYDQGFVPAITRKDISWPNNAVLPSIRPDCGYTGCQGLSEGAKNTIKIIAIVIGSIVAVMFAAACVFRVYKKDQDLKDLSWRVDFKELTDRAHDHNVGDDDTESESSGSSSVTDVRKDMTRAKTVSLDSIQISSTQRKIFRNIHVFNKPLVSELFINVFNDIELMKNLKYLKDLNSDYLVNVIGLCQEPVSNNFWLVTEDCHKGTLMDVLDDETMELDSTLKLSMIDDIATGMAFIHNKTNIGSHGNLKTTNILVSDNFTMKIGDYGECVFMSDMKKMYHHSELEYNKRLLWRAPELARKKYIDVCGTKSGDTYSFAIVVHEIINLMGPFNLHSPDNYETPNSVILKVKDKTLDKPFRPEFTSGIKNKPLRKIANMVRQNWWNEDPDKRDAFKKICGRLKRVNPKGSKKGNFLDRAVKRMEKFSDALAEKAAEREAQVDAEIKKVNELKEYFVPRVLIKAGLDTFEPEKLSDTSVAVIELAGLTYALSHGKTIQQVVELETKFRTVIDRVAHGGPFFFGQGQKVRRLWVCSRVTDSQKSDHLGTLKIVEKVIQKMMPEISASGLKDVNVCVKAGMHTGTIHTGLLGNGEETAPRFAFLGVYEEADTLCSLTQGSEILVSPQAHKAIQSASDNDIVLDWGEKQQYESGQVYEAYCLSVKPLPKHRKESKA